MTLLLGDQNFTGYTGAGPTNADGGYLAPAPFVAPATGTITTLNAWITPGTGTSFQMGLYDGVLQRLAFSSTVTVAAAGPVQFPIQFPVSQGRVYQILLTGNGTFQFGVDGSLATKAFKVSNGATLPYQLTSPVTTAFGAPAFFADGDSTGQILSTSGLIQRGALSTATLIARGYGRCRIPYAKVSDEMVDVAKDELFLLLSDLANGPTPLWAIEQDLLPMIAGTQTVPTPSGTVDVKNLNYRQILPLQQTSSLVYNALTPTQVETLSVTWSGPALPLQLLMGSKVILSVTPNASAGQQTFFDLDGTVPTSQWTVLGSNISNVGFYTNNYEIPMYAFSRDEWSFLPNRAFPGSPRQFWFEHLVAPLIHLWPVPQTADQTQACLVLFRHRHIQDVGELPQRIEAPQNWFPAIVDMLAEKLAVITPEVPMQWVSVLQAYAAKSRASAMAQNRENASTKIMPNIYRYTR